MKKTIFLLIFLVLVGFTSAQTKSGNDDIVKLSSEIGYLVVHTDTYEKYNGDINWNVFKGYRIYDKNEKLVKIIAESYETPNKVKLNEGTYIIKAEFPGKKQSKYEVLVEQGKTTEVIK